MIWQSLSIAIVTYFLGSIPFALLVSRAKGVDLRSQGSGNLGATNVFRVMGWKFGLLVFLLDGFKGWLPTFLAIQVFDTPWLHVGVGVMAIIGHILSCFVQFKGGKGAATGLGVLLALNPLVFGILFIIAASLIRITRYVAPVTILCSILAPCLLYYFQSPNPYTFMVTCISIFIILRHTSNIKRLLQGKENRL